MSNKNKLPHEWEFSQKETTTMNKRTELYLRFIIPIKYRLRRRVIWWLENAVDRLNLDKSHRYDGAVSFTDYLEIDDGSFGWREFVTDDDLFTFDDDDNNNY